MDSEWVLGRDLKKGKLNWRIKIRNQNVGGRTETKQMRPQSVFLFFQLFASVFCKEANFRVLNILGRCKKPIETDNPFNLFYFGAMFFYISF